ncbi:MAG: hypothetical protein ACRDHY_05480 [Anaerolineales bacterium]
MKKATARKNNGLRREYDLSKLRGGVRGKYYRRYSEGTNMVLLDPDIADVFPNAKAVNDALRLLVKVAGARVQRSRRNKRG